MDFGVVTPREREVFDLLGDHLTHEQIARQLFVSVRTVESHVASLRRKLDTPDHRALVRLAVEHRRGPGAGSAAPTPLTSFVGRAHELAELNAAVTAARLVSVVGPGGAGKTRLALAVAGALGSQFSDGVRWVDLVPVRDGAGLEDALAQACGAVVTGRREPADAVIAVLRGRQTLLVLDNCEHLVNAVAVLVERVLNTSPGVNVLLTSRQRLAVPFERVFPVAGLSADIDGDAVALFVERARSAGAAAPSPPERERISAICVAIGGLPLAVELAAVRMPALGLDGVERGLLDQAGLLTAGPRASLRHRSMNDTLDWSLALLPGAAAIALRRLAVFAAPFDLHSAIAVAGFSQLPVGDVPAMLTQLVEQSLVTAETAGGQSRTACWNRCGNTASRG